VKVDRDVCNGESSRRSKTLMEIAARYRDLALEIDDAEWRLGAVIAPAKQK
jgi:hypothetical protein